MSPETNIKHQSETLSKCRMLGRLTQSQRIELATHAAIQEYGQGTWLCRQGDEGHELYVLIEGTIEVVLEDNDSDQIILARFSDAGDALGEQAARTPGGRRNVSIRAVTAVRVVTIPGAAFREMLSTSTELDSHIQSLGVKQAQARELSRRSALYAAIAVYDQCHELGQVEHFPAGTIICREGARSDHVYIIRNGQAEVSQDVAGQQVLLCTLGEGQTFGELGINDASSRVAQVAAQTDLEVLTFKREGFLQVASASPEVRDYLSTLRMVYSLPSQGPAAQFSGHLDGTPAIVTIFHAEDNRRAITHHSIGRQLYHGVMTGHTDQAIHKLLYEDLRRNVRREIALVDHVPVEVSVQGPWRELHAIHDAMLQQRPLPSESLARFEEKGSIYEASPGGSSEEVGNQEHIVCLCLAIPRSKLDIEIAKGASNIADLAASTGATTVCGSCTAQVARMLGTNEGTKVQLLSTTRQCPGIQSYSLVVRNPLDDFLALALPGQHVVVSAEIDKRWVSRPYTLSSSALNTSQREITVKLEPHGYFSRWLADNADNDPNIRISSPRGDYWVDLTSVRPVVCFVAGIGMTPAIAIARTVADAESGHTLPIDYSAPLVGQFAHRSELEQLARDHANISIRLRVTAAGERIQAADVASCHQRFLGARYFICGPSGYQKAVRSYLLEAGVDEHSIQIETFTPVGRAPTTLPPPRSRDVAVIAIGLILLVAYLAQAALGFHWPWLEVLQTEETYRRWSGAVLSLYILAQWVLPLRRHQGDPIVLARAITVHRALGAVAPLVFYAHSTRFGYAMLLALSVAYLGNVVVGLFDKTWIRDSAARARYARLWLVPHILLSCMVAGLTLVHIWVVFAYQGGGTP